jgi:hypothetical protein
MVTRAELDTYVGREITTICGNGFTDPNHNHCAHFVSHVLGFGFLYTCRNMVHGPKPAANIRVHEIFSQCPSVGTWASHPASLDPCLVFITNPSHVDLVHRTMVNHPKKHIGIFCDGEVWHYSNTRDKVVRVPPASFARHYSTPHNGMFYGEIPSGSM